jgi:hypothetical protein
VLKEVLKKFKPDLRSRDENGKVLSEGYSDAKLAERDKAKNAVAQLENAITVALVDGQYEQLDKALEKGD